MTIFYVFLLALYAFTAVECGEIGREMRAIRMSLVDFWKNETRGDGLNIKVAHGVNSWPDLVDQLHEPFLNKSLMIEGDVFLQSMRRPRHRAIPVMRAETRVADRITFKEWIQEVANLNKAIKINFRSTEVVRPVLHFLYASQSDPTSPILQFPVILHANVFRSARSVESEVDPAVFVEKTKKYFPDATVSLGWTKQQNYSKLEEKHKRISWHELFSILEYVDRLDQPVMLSLRLTVASNSADQLLWLLGMEKSISLLIWSDAEDEISNWKSIIELRKQSTKNRVLYDLHPTHRTILQNISAENFEATPRFSLSDWHSVEFSSPVSQLSTVVQSSRGPAFIGFPAAILISNKENKIHGKAQTVEGKVHFLAKHRDYETNFDEKSGLIIYLTDKMQEIESAKIKKGLQVFIGFNGRVSIENKHGGRHSKKDSKSIGQLPKSDCYSFKVKDHGWKVTAEVWNSICEGQETKRNRREITKIDLQTEYKPNSHTKTVVLSKTGDGSVDFLLEELKHNSTFRIFNNFVVFILILCSILS